MVLYKSSSKMKKVRLRKTKMIRNDLRVVVCSLKMLFFCRYATMLVIVTAQVDSVVHVVINLALEEV